MCLQILQNVHGFFDRHVYTPEGSLWHWIFTRSDLHNKKAHNIILIFPESQHVSPNIPQKGGCSDMLMRPSIAGKHLSLPSNFYMHMRHTYVQALSKHHGTIIPCSV